jgi:hypothetical protein
MESAGEQGVLLASLGTIAELGERTLQDLWLAHACGCGTCFHGLHTLFHASVLCAVPESHQTAAMAAVFASLPCKVLWRLTPREVPDQAAIARLGLGNNTKVHTRLKRPHACSLPCSKICRRHCGFLMQVSGCTGGHVDPAKRHPSPPAHASLPDPCRREQPVRGEPFHSPADMPGYVIVHAR